MMSSSPTPSSSGALHDNTLYVNNELTTASSSSQYLHHMTSNTVDQNMVSSTQHNANNHSHNHISHQQPFKHMLAQKYAAESTSEQTGSSSENNQQMHHNMQQFYAYSPLVSSSCSSHHFESNLLDANSVQNDVIHVESTSGQMDTDDTHLIQSNIFHDNVMDNLIKHEQQSTSMNSGLVSSTSTPNMCRQDMIFECNSEAVDSTTSAGHQLSYVQPIHTYQEPIDKLSIQSLVSMQSSDPSHHLLQTHYLHPNSDNQMPILQQQAVEQCVQPIEEQSHQTNNVSVELEVPQEHVISDLPVLSRARASLPSEYLYIEETDNSIGVIGVFAKKTIPKRTQFGPVEGVIVGHNHSNVHNFNHNLMIFITETLILDQSDENQSNWMKFVRSANTYEEQNLALITKENITGNEIEIKFFFHTTRAIYAREELKVWYSREYAEKFNLKVLEPRPPIPEVEEQNNENIVPKPNTNPIDIVATGGHKLRNKIAKTQQQLQQQQQQQQQQIQQQQPETQPIVSQTISNSSVTTAKDNTSQPKYQCETCQKVFPRFYSLRRHQIMHSGEKKYKCPICFMSFSHVYNRNRHVKKHSKSPVTKKLIVETQGTSDQILDNLTETMKKSTNNTNDELMKAPTSVPIVARKSSPKVVNNSNKPFRCHECYKCFTTDDRLLRHAIVHSSDEDVKPLACDICQKRFLNNSALSCHLKVHSTPKDQPRRYDCVICKQWFDSTQQRKDHIITHANPITGQFTCPNCSKGFDEFAAVRKHIRAFHSDKQYPCTQCEKVFPRPDKLKLHMLRHSDHREFLCANCGKQFKRKDKLKEHMQRMHAPDREAKLAAKQAAKQAQQMSQQNKKFIPKVSPTDYHRFIYKCHTCLLGFKRRGMLVNHLAKRHPDIPPDSVPELNLPILKTTRDYYCQYCDKIYKSSSKRKAHIMKNHPGKSLPLSNRHKGGIPLVPGVPNPTYSATVGSITTHPHYCDWCHKQYASKAKLLQHQRKKHPEQMAIINCNARTRQRTTTPTAAPISTQSMTGQTITQTPNIMSTQSTSQSTVAVGSGVSTNLITILGNINNIISATMNNDLSQTNASTVDLQELLQGSSSDLLTQAMSELTATKGEGGTTLIITTHPSDDDHNWSQVCGEINEV
ncbi:PR domain zinc finger protein 10-like [Oppia nitens]|uniref:PR domain zinc finger protein 10-like n=1 Tax=Oppia nitens TaxID=1686743 RepID=UPI0023DA070F|nr:PR domain zinc finger protein 10-like [Oppia nitens]